MPSDVLQLRRLGRSSEECQYLIFGREGRVPGGTPHLQGYVEFVKRKRGPIAKACVSRRAHLEVRKGTGWQAAMYCQKEGDFEEFGTPPKEVMRPGHRSDLDSIKTLLDDGASMEDIAESSFSQWVIHRRAFKEYLDMKCLSRDFATEVFVLWGETGTGKTRYVHDEERDLWVAPDNELQWFDGFNGQAAVLFDDFTGVHPKKFGFLLKLLDRYPMTVPVKGGYVNWAPKRIYFTSNINPVDWYTGVTATQVQALRRRITKITHYN